jgi:O-antigen ligase/tetratricopeptide (TPR) repeat protein
MLLAPLRAAQFDRAAVAAVNALIAAAVALGAMPAKTAGGDYPKKAAGQAAAGSSDVAPWRREPVTLCLGLFLALNLLSLAVSLYVHGTLTALLDLSALFCAYLLLAHGGGGRRAVDWALGALLLAGVVAAAQALSEYGVEAWWHNNPGWRAFGPFFNPNLLAASAILLAPVMLALMLRAERPGERLGAGAGTLLFVAALLVSGSRGGALSRVVGGLAFIGVAAVRGLRLDRRRALAVGGLVIALLPVLWVFRVPMLGRLAHIRGTPAVAAGSPAANASERSNAFRVLIWKATARMVRAKPLLGTGAGTFEFALPRYTVAGYTRMAHESYLQIAAEAGVPALLAWLGALALALARLGSRHGTRDWLLPGLAGGLVAAMAHNGVDYSWSVTGTALPFWALLGAAVALTPGAPQFKVQQTSEHLNARRPSRLTFGLAGMLLLGLNAVWLTAAAHQARAQAAVAERDARAAVDEYQAAVALTPLDAALQVELAGIEGAIGDTEAAVAAYRRAAALAPTWGRPHYRLGRLLENSGKLPEATAEFERAAALDPRATQPLVALAQVLEAQGRHEAALAVYQRIVAMERTVGALDEMTDPNPAVAHDALGREAEAHGDREAAIREYRAGAERLRRWRFERPYRDSILEARGESPTDRETDLLRLEVRLWQRLTGLYAQAGQTQEAVEARREETAAEAAAKSAAGS